MSWRINASGTKTQVLEALEPQGLRSRNASLSDRQYGVVMRAAKFLRYLVKTAPDGVEFDFTFGGHIETDGFAGGDAKFVMLRPPQG